MVQSASNSNDAAAAIISTTTSSAMERNRIRELEARVATLEKENRRLQRQPNTNEPSEEGAAAAAAESSNEPPTHHPISQQAVLTRDQIERYSRQLLLNEGFGVEGQLKLLSSSVLVVGAGGIGSTVLLYLAASGIGKISIVDFDAVEMSNLHRQVIHKNRDTGLNKAASARRAVLDLNPTIQCEALPVALTHENALEIIQNYDCIVDASDNPRTRYLINDACVLSGKPLVSGSAVGVEAQLTVYNLNNIGSCYRCLYPKAQASAGCQACSDAGVLGPVPGLIGILQSMETLKVLTGVGTTMHNRLLMYDALECSFFTVKKPTAKSPNCPICGPAATIRSMRDSHANLMDARGPTGVIVGNKMALPEPTYLPEGVEITCQDYSRIQKEGQPHVLLDVRVTKQYEMCALDGAVNVPLGTIPDHLDRIEELSGGTKPIYCVCRRGVASREAAKILLEAQTARSGIHSVHHIEGGLTSWHQNVDSSFPKY